MRNDEIVLEMTVTAFDLSASDQALLWCRNKDGVTFCLSLDAQLDHT